MSKIFYMKASGRFGSDYIRADGMRTDDPNEAAIFTTRREMFEVLSRNMTDDELNNAEIREIVVEGRLYFEGNKS